jgi:hypothetical protein
MLFFPFIGIDLQTESTDQVRQQFNKCIPVAITSINILFTIVTRHHMIKSVRIFYSQLPFREVMAI